MLLAGMHSARDSVRSIESLEGAVEAPTDRTEV